MEFIKAAAEVLVQTAFILAIVWGIHAIADALSPGHRK